MSGEELGDWIEWSGGECPVAAGVMHERRYRNGDTGIYRQKTGIMPRTWAHFDDDDDIIAYRVVRP